MCLRGEVMLKAVGGGRGGGCCHLFMLPLLLLGFVANVSTDNKARFAYHNPHLSTFWSGVLGGTAVFFAKETEMERKREREERKKNSVHFESCLKFSGRVQIALKHVHGIERLNCIKKNTRRRDGRKKGGQGGEAEGNFLELVRTKSFGSDVTAHAEKGSLSNSTFELQLYFFWRHSGLQRK